MLRDGVPSRATPALTVHVSQAKQRPPLPEDPDDVVPEGYVPPPQTASIGDMLAQALERSTLQVKIKIIYKKSLKSFLSNILNISRILKLTMGVRRKRERK